MKTTFFITISTILVLCATQPAKCQKPASGTYADNLPVSDVQATYRPSPESVVKPEPVVDDVVINRTMVENFRRDSAKMDPFSLTDYLRQEPSDISIRFMAYLRERFDTTQGNLEKTLAAELESVRKDIGNNTLNFMTINFTEEKAAGQPEPGVQEKHPATPNPQVQKQGKEKSGLFKWIHITNK